MQCARAALRSITVKSLTISYRALRVLRSPNDVLKVAGNGYRMGLALVIDAKVDDYSVTNGKFDGFKVIENSISKINVFF